MPWAVKRRLIYTVGALILFLIVFGYPIYSAFRVPPSCFDNKQNENEKGIDCDGPCVKLCKPLELTPIIEWQQAFEVEPGTYTAVAYVENPNINAEAFSVPYTFTLYDGQGNKITERAGIAHIPAGKNFAIVEGGISVPQNTTVSQTTFSFGANYSWLRVRDNLPLLTISNLVLTATTSPTVDADITNTGITPTGRVDVAAIVYNDAGNAVAASKTFIDNIDGESSQHVVFTWPQSFPTQSQTCQTPSDSMLAVDRSGSIADSLGDIKNAATTFISNLQDKDQVGLISFATTPSSPIDSPLSTDFNAVKTALQNISIHSDGLQYTDIADTITAAENELSSSRHNPQAKTALVLLTDGVANRPVKTGDPNFASTTALAAAALAKTKGIEIFTIGLGSDIDSGFLQSIASGNKDFFNAATSKDLNQIYTQISQSICTKQPVRVEVIPDLGTENAQ